MSLEAIETATYKEIWSVDSYAEMSPGESLAPVFQSLTDPGTVLDAGAGSGKGALALRDLGYTVGMIDLTSNGLVPEAAGIPMVEGVPLWDIHRVRAALYLLRLQWEDDSPDGMVDYVYCTDVMEHIPATFTMLSAANMLAIARKGAFFSISTKNDQFGAWVGKRLHQSVQPFTAWRDQLKVLGRLKDARDLGATALFFLEHS